MSDVMDGPENKVERHVVLSERRAIDLAGVLRGMDGVTDLDFYSPVKDNERKRPGTVDAAQGMTPGGSS